MSRAATYVRAYDRSCLNGAAEGNEADEDRYYEAELHLGELVV